MSEPGDTTDTPGADSAGAMLRAARQAQGLHVAALATTLKVAPRKLEALEADRYDEFQGATFVRALAHAACRALKIDPAPVLARLPALDGGTLSQLGNGLNAPFRERGARRESADVPLLGRAVAGVVVLLLLGALGFMLLPSDWRWPGSGAANTTADGGEPVSVPVPIIPPAPAASTIVADAPETAASMPASQADTRVESARSEPALAEPAASTPPAAAGTLLQLRARNASWIEVIDGRAQVLLARTLSPGEVVGIDGVLPLRVKIGNAAATELSFRGRPVDLAAASRDNVARLELK